MIRLSPDKSEIEKPCTDDRLQQATAELVENLLGLFSGSARPELLSEQCDAFLAEVDKKAAAEGVSIDDPVRLSLAATASAEVAREQRDAPSAGPVKEPIQRPKPRQRIVTVTLPRLEDQRSDNVELSSDRKKSDRQA